MRFPRSAVSRCLPRHSPTLLALALATCAACGARSGLDQDAQQSGSVANPDPSLPKGYCTNVANAPADRAPITIGALAAEPDIAAIAVDANEVFYSVCAKGPPSSGKIRAVPKTGGTPRDVTESTPGRCIKQLMVDDTHVFFLTDIGRSIGRVPKTGGAGIAIGRSIHSFDMDRDYLYAGLDDGPPAGIWRYAKDGSDVALFFATDHIALRLAVRDGWVYWSENRTRHPSEPTSQKVWRAAVSGGAAEELGLVTDFTGNVAVDCRHVYISGRDGQGAAWRLPTSAGEAQKFANVHGVLAIDAASLYAQDTYHTWRVSLSTGNIADLGRGNGRQEVQGIAVDDTAVYWSTGTTLFRGEK